MESMPSQSSIVSVNGSWQLLKSPWQESLSIENQVDRAEVSKFFMLWLLIIQFSSTNEDSERFKCMFPDSKIVVRYSQHADKTWYVVVHGIAPYVKSLLMNDVKNTFFVTNSTKSQHRRSKHNMMDMLCISKKNINKSVLAIGDLSLLAIVTAKL